MQGIDFDAMDRVLDAWQKIVREFPERKGEALERLGQTVEKRVKESIAGSPDGGRMTLQAWQRYYLGSKRGYVAVRPIGGISGPNGPGAITNYNENGHAIRKPSGIQKPGYKYRPRIKKARVDGQHFYYRVDNTVNSEAERVLKELAEEFAQRMDDAS